MPNGTGRPPVAIIHRYSARERPGEMQYEQRMYARLEFAVPADGLAQAVARVHATGPRLAEDVLGCQIPIQPVAHGIGMEDLAPLLKHLRDQRRAANPLMPLSEVDPLKLDFNRIREEAREDLLRGMRQSHLVEAFYIGTLRAVEHDEVAQGFRLYYEQVRRDFPDPEDVLWQLELYVLGNGRVPPRTQRAAWVVLAHFFERCDIFDALPPGGSGPLGIPA